MPGTDPDLFYDDESEDPTTADLIQGVSSIPAGGAAIVVIGDMMDAMTFVSVWGEVIDLSGVDVGYVDGAGLGGGGDVVSIWIGNPAGTANTPDATGEYPATDANDAQSFDIALNTFSDVMVI